MKSLLLFSLSLLISISTQAQSKKEIKDFEYVNGATVHKKFYDNDEWAICKFSIIYKLSTASVAKDMAKNKEVGAKVKSSSGAYAMLEGVSEADLQVITNKVAENFIKRMKDEAGVSIVGWSEIKNASNTDKLLESAEEKEIYSKSQGLAYAMTFQDAPHYNRVVVLIPGGKKLSKEIDKHVVEVSMIIDFADVVAEADAVVNITGRSSTAISYEWGESADQKIYTGVRLMGNIGGNDAGEANLSLATTKLFAHDKYGYYFGISGGVGYVSDVSFADSIEKNEGEVPAILANRRNNKIEYASTFNVSTTPAKYEEAVLDVTNKWFDNIIKYYTWNQ